MSIELNIALPNPEGGRPQVHYLSIQRLNLESGLGTYRIGEWHQGHFLAEATYPHRYVEGWERCVSRGLAALADQRRETA